jgi:hypothetical protein
MYTNCSACSLGVSYPALKCSSISSSSSSSSSHDIKIELDGHKYSNMRSYIGGYAVSDRICIMHEL